MGTGEATRPVGAAPLTGPVLSVATPVYARTARHASAGTPVPGLGVVGGSNASTVEVVARRGNVVVEVEFGADADSVPDDATRADVVEVARAAAPVTLR